MVLSSKGRDCIGKLLIYSYICTCPHSALYHQKPHFQGNLPLSELQLSLDNEESEWNKRIGERWCLRSFLHSSLLVIGLWKWMSFHHGSGLHSQQLRPLFQLILDSHHQEFRSRGAALDLSSGNTNSDPQNPLGPGLLDTTILMGSFITPA